MTPLVESICELDVTIDHTHPRAADASEALASNELPRKGDVDDALALAREYSGAVSVHLILNNKPIAHVYWARTKPWYRWL